MVVQMAGEGPEVPLHQSRDLGVELHRVDPAHPVALRLKHVGTAAGSQDQDPPGGLEMVGQGGGQLVQIGQRRRIAAVAGDDRHGVAVGENSDLIRRY